MSRPSKKLPAKAYIRLPYDELGRLDNLLKHGVMGVQFTQQALDGLREVIGTGVVYRDVGRSNRKSGDIASAKAMFSLREADERRGRLIPIVGKVPAGPPRRRRRKGGKS
jgi:hypothetical protein